MSKNKNGFTNWLNNKYVFSVRNNERFMESSKATLSVYEVGILLFMLALVSVVASYLLFQYSPLKKLFGQENTEQQQTYYQLHHYADSLEKVVQLNQRYLTNIQNIVDGEMISEPYTPLDSQELTNVEVSDPTEEELALRDEVQQREQFSIRNNGQTSDMKFVKPVDGVISKQFEPNEKHYGTDIVAPKGTPVLATAAGIVIYTTWSEQDGSTIIVSHDNDFISIYKHNEKLLKTIGERVQAGDAIALLGNSGENTSGYHVHFELWQNGIPKDPEKRITLQ